MWCVVLVNGEGSISRILSGHHSQTAAVSHMRFLASYGDYNLYDLDVYEVEDVVD